MVASIPEGHVAVELADVNKQRNGSEKCDANEAVKILLTGNLAA